MPRSSLARTTLLTTIAALCPLALAACSGSTTTTTRGRYVSDETVAMLRASNTDADWAFLMFGTPGKKHHDDATGHDTWSWDFYKASRDPGIQRSTQVYERTMFIEFDNTGAIVRAWATSTDESIDE